MPPCVPLASLAPFVRPEISTGRPLRILHAVFSSRIAGSERYCIDLANRQAALGHEVHVAGAEPSPLRGALAHNVHFHGFGRLFRGFRLRRLIDRLQPEICHSHLSAACKAVGRGRRPHRTVATLHVGYKAHQHGRFDGVICVNRAQATRLDGYAGKVRIISNWLPEVPAPGCDRGIRAELGLGKEVLLIGAVGRLHPSKGMDVLVSAFRAAAPADAALVLIGEGPHRAELEQLRAGDPRIHLLGYRTQVNECLRDLDLFVSPSREESFGLAIIEAMRAGLPIIATAAEGPAEFLQDQPVTLVPTGDVAALASALGAAAGQFAAHQLHPLTYDLGFCAPSDRIANIMDFYGHLIDAPQTAQARGWIPAQAAT